MTRIIKTNREGLNYLLEQEVKKKIAERIRKASLNEWEDDEEDNYTSDLLNSDMFTFDNEDFASPSGSDAAAVDGENDFSDDEEEIDDIVDYGDASLDSLDEPESELDEPEETPEIEHVKQWSDRGDEMEIDGIPITQENGKFSIIAKESNPEVTITGSDLNAVKSMYNSMWNRGFSEVAPFAYKYGYANYEGVLINSDEAKSMGIDISGLPLVINIDKR